MSRQRANLSFPCIGCMHGLVPLQHAPSAAYLCLLSAQA